MEAHRRAKYSLPELFGLCMYVIYARENVFTGFPRISAVVIGGHDGMRAFFYLEEVPGHCNQVRLLSNAAFIGTGPSLMPTIKRG